MNRPADGDERLVPQLPEPDHVPGGERVRGAYLALAAASAALAIVRCGPLGQELGASGAG